LTTLTTYRNGATDLTNRIRIAVAAFRQDQGRTPAAVVVSKTEVSAAQAAVKALGLDVECAAPAVASFPRSGCRRPKRRRAMLDVLKIVAVVVFMILLGQGIVNLPTVSGGPSKRRSLHPDCALCTQGDSADLHGKSDGKASMRAIRTRAKLARKQWPHLVGVGSWLFPMERVVRLPVADVQTFGRFGRLIVSVRTIRPGRFYFKVGVLASQPALL
jgi:hypothetical protein